MLKAAAPKPFPATKPLFVALLGWAQLLRTCAAYDDSVTSAGAVDNQIEEALERLDLFPPASKKRKGSVIGENSTQKAARASCGSPSFAGGAATVSAVSDSSSEEDGLQLQIKTAAVRLTNTVQSGGYGGLNLEEALACLKGSGCVSLFICAA
jgi:hypothetical protein